jgi:hypothetical protein
MIRASPQMLEFVSLQKKSAHLLKTKGVAAAHRSPILVCLLIEFFVLK